MGYSQKNKMAAARRIVSMHVTYAVGDSYIISLLNIEFYVIC